MKQLLLLFTLFTITISAQEREFRKPKKIEVGLFLDYNYNHHLSSITNFSYINSCCDEFSSGGSSAFFTGIYSSFPISRDVQLQARLNYADLSADFIENRNTTVNLDNRALDGAFEHGFLTSIKAFGLSLYSEYNLSYEFSVLAGPTIMNIASAQYEHYEKLIRPESRAVFSDTESRIRNVQSGDIQNINQLMYTFDLGISLDFPLDKRHKAFLSTEMIYNIALTDFTTDQDWKANSFRIGLTFKYEFYRWSVDYDSPLKPATKD